MSFLTSDLAAVPWSFDCPAGCHRATKPGSAPLGGVAGPVPVLRRPAGHNQGS